MSNNQLQILYIVGYLDDQNSPLSKFLFNKFKNKYNFFIIETFKIKKKSSVNSIKNKIRSHLNNNKNTIIISHSLGCYFSLLFKDKVKKHILIDPSNDLIEMFPDRKKYKNIKKYKDLLKDRENLNFIGTENGSYKNTILYKEMGKNNYTKIIKNADHNFTTKKNKEDLLEEIIFLIKKSS